MLQERSERCSHKEEREKEEDTTNIPKLPGPLNTETPNFKITVQGVTKLLCQEGLNDGKASGPDELPNLILKNAANEISPFLKIIFDQSLQTDKLPYQMTG